MDGLPIDLNIIEMRKEIPKKIAELSYKDEKEAIHYLRLWGEKKIAITEIYEQLCQSLQDKVPLAVGN